MLFLTILLFFIVMIFLSTVLANSITFQHETQWFVGLVSYIQLVSIPLQCVMSSVNFTLKLFYS